jgi:uncharacterized protein (TIGR01777 family)
MSRTILVSGASGLIGTALNARLRGRGDRVVALVRRPVRSDDEIQWDPAAGNLPKGAVDGVDVVVNFSGAGIGDKRWSERRKKEILQSRLDSTGLLARAIAESPNPPAAFLSASAIGIYGQDRGDELLDEEATTGADFGARVAVQWEQATDPAVAAGVRVVHFRTGLVLSKPVGWRGLLPSGGGGLLGPLVPLFKMGLGGRIASGKQWMSWISIDDEVAALAHLMDSSLSGPVNLVAPHPATNAEFTTTLAKTLRRPALFVIPRFALVVRFGREMAQGIALANERVSSERLVSDGFGFSYPELEPALRHVLDR